MVGDDSSPSPGMLANITIRCVVNLLAVAACWVPMRLFQRMGELAGMTMVAAMALLNFYYAVNAMIWHDDNIGSWSEGYGWCDVQLVSWIPLETLNAAAIYAIIHNIANQVSLTRATGLEGQEKRRKQISQALIIFPVPLLQVVLYYFVIPMRYNISGVVGCQAVFEANWVFLVFFVLPCPLFAVAAAGFASEADPFPSDLLFSSHPTDFCAQSSLGGGTGGSTPFSEKTSMVPATSDPRWIGAGQSEGSTSWRSQS